jgi:hypothetical protein
MKYQSSNLLSPFAFLVMAGMMYRSIAALSRLTSTRSMPMRVVLSRNALNRLHSSTTTDFPTAATELLVDAVMPYEGHQPKEALSEIFVPQMLSHNLPNGKQLDDELLWVPQTNSVSFRPLCFCVSSGYYCWRTGSRIVCWWCIWLPTSSISSNLFHLKGDLSKPDENARQTVFTSLPATTNIHYFCVWLWTKQM